MTDTAHPLPHPLRIVNFRNYWIARFCATLAQAALMLLIGWQLYGIARTELSVKESAFLLGMIGLVQFLPLFVLTPVTGWIADRYDRRMVGRSALVIQFGCALLLAVLTYRGETTMGALFATAFFLGIARAFSGPAFSALAPNLVPKAVLPTAIAVSSIAWQVGMIAGPSLGGFLYAVDPVLAFGTSCALFLASIITVSLIGKVRQPAADRVTKPVRQMIEGLKYVRVNRLVLAAITLDLFAVLLAGATALLPAFARDILQVDARGLGLLASSMGIGAAVTAAWYSWRPLKTDVGTKMLVAVVVFGVAIIVFGLSKSLWLSVGALAIAGGADMVSVYVRQSLIQLHTPDAMRGRVSSVSLLTISASNELGEAESGFLAALIGPVAAVVLGGVGAIAITLAWARLFPELRLAKSFDPPDIDDNRADHSSEPRSAP